MLDAFVISSEHKCGRAKDSLMVVRSSQTFEARENKRSSAGPLLPPLLPLHKLTNVRFPALPWLRTTILWKDTQMGGVSARLCASASRIFSVICRIAVRARDQKSATCRVFKQLRDHSEHHRMFGKKTGYIGNGCRASEECPM